MSRVLDREFVTLLEGVFWAIPKPERQGDALNLDLLLLK